MTDKLVERLRKIPLYEGHGEPSSLPEDAADALEAQQARIAELEEALNPFAEEAAHWGDYRDDVTLVEDIPGYDGFIRVRDLRRAKQVMEGK